MRRANGRAATRPVTSPLWVSGSFRTSWEVGMAGWMIVPAHRALPTRDSPAGRNQVSGESRTQAAVA